MTGSFGDSDTRTPSIGSSESGQALVWFVAALMVLLGFAALTIDVGSAFHDSGKLQNAADAASLAGAAFLPQGSVRAINEARDYAQKNGYVIGVTGTFTGTGWSGTQNGYTVSITTPYNGDPTKIAVTISGQTPAVFATVLGINFLSVSRHAVATYYGTTQLNAALLALDKTACRSYRLTGSAVVTITTGGLMSNSSCNPSLYDSGSGSTTATAIQYYTGSYYTGAFTPTPVAVSSRMPDPLASMIPPDLASLDQFPSGANISGNVDVTLQPGVYTAASRSPAAAP
jgi:Flp pilus assembly protein TadG